jgi:Xaa-Pro aminopeptidase
MICQRVTNDLAATNLKADTAMTQQLKPAVTLADVRRAADVIAGAVLNTDFDHSRTLSDLTGANIWLKFENLQFTAAFKEQTRQPDRC